MASLPAILEAMLRSLEMSSPAARVLQMANRRQMRALAKDRPASSAPDWRPAWLLFMSRSPMNMVAALERKSEPTMERATLMLPENLREVTKVTLPAMTRHMRALTADRAVVSEKLVPSGTLPRARPSR